jgi:hypothetical protein
MSKKWKINIFSFYLPNIDFSLYSVTPTWTDFSHLHHILISHFTLFYKWYPFDCFLSGLFLFLIYFWLNKILIFIHFVFSQTQSPFSSLPVLRLLFLFVLFVFYFSKKNEEFDRTKSLCFYFLFIQRLQIIIINS